MKAAETPQERDKWIAREHADYLLAALRDVALGHGDKALSATAAQQRAQRCLRSIGLGWKTYDKRS